ncbi:shikimate dehydrogenase [Lentisphaera profundi]|uniref:Shikimate dehydrogenase (NADP(+)) n=1 Tax=Lentisphaera profundi TaxID=1658616 RepID=A0ABY7VU32_9BACT|nr:shikimate dehydrogenase [Lentisphaera profundi]WDE97237.1 shikimate dehydrogenase [Lentisphaera profundi]
MLKYGLIGWPVNHSLSPSIHNPAFKEMNLNANYNLIECPPDDINSIIDGLKAESYKGWNCTVPLKADIIPLLDWVDKEALACQSVNTVIVQKDGKLHGYSTDGYGIETAIKEEFGISLNNKRVLFVGAGGAARAAAARIAKSGATAITVINRSEANAQLLLDTAKLMNPGCETQFIASSDLSKHTKICQEYDILIQCTSLGLKDGDAQPFPSSLLHSSILVMDMIYKETPFQIAAKEAGCKTAGGLGMLLHQGVKSWEMWTDMKAPVEIMRKNLIEAAYPHD